MHRKVKKSFAVKAKEKAERMRRRRAQLKDDTTSVIFPGEERVGTSLKTNERVGTSLKTKERVGASLKTKERVGTSLKTNEDGKTSIKTKMRVGTSEKTKEAATTSIKTKERMGTSQKNKEVAKTSIKTTEMIGTSDKTKEVVQTSIKTTERMGTSQKNKEVAKTSIKTTEMIGTPDKTKEAVQTSIKTTERMGTSQKNKEVVKTSIKTTENNKYHSNKKLDIFMKNNTVTDNPNNTLGALHGILQGSFHQGSQRFGNNSGKQCVGNALAAIVHSQLKHVNEWNQSYLDNVLVTGNEIYTKIHGNNAYLLVTELPHMLRVSDILVECQRKESIMAMISTVNGINLDEFQALPLDQALQEALIDTDGCFITVMDNTFIVIKNNGKLYIFDSHSRNNLGLPDPNGSSIVIELQNHDHLYQHCLNFVQGRNLSHVMFEITGISVSLQNIVSTDDELHVDNDQNTVSTDDELHVDNDQNTNNSTSLRLSSVGIKNVTDTEKVDLENNEQFNRLESQNITEHHDTRYVRDEIHDTNDIDSITNSDIEITTEETGMLYNFRPLCYSSKKQLCTVLNIPSSFVCKTKSLDQDKIGPPLQTKSITGDGNCLFRALSYAISHRQQYQDKVRKAIVNHLLENSENFQSFLEPQYRNIQEHVSEKHMLTDGVWGTALEIVAAADLLKTDIYTFYEGHWIKYSTTQVCGSNSVANERAIYIKHVTEFNHYEFVLSVAQNSMNQSEDGIEVSKRKRITPSMSSVPKKKVKRFENKSDSEVDQDTNTRSKKSTKAEKEKLKYQSSPSFRKRKLDKYQNDFEYRSKCIKLNRKKYETDELFREQKVERGIAKYTNNEYYRKILKRTSIDKYANNEEFRKNVTQASVNKYANDDDFRKNVMQASVNKYANDDDFRKNVMQASVNKYANDQDFRKNVMQTSVKKYAYDDSFRKNAMHASVNKYANNEEFKRTVIQASVDKYADDEQHRTCIKEQTNKRRQNIKKENEDMNKGIAKFKIEAKKGPEYVCSCCFRLCFENQVTACKIETYKDNGGQSIAKSCISDKYLHKCCDGCSEKCEYAETNRSELWICHTCHRKIKKGTIPADSFANNLNLEEIPKELKCLNSLEQHLIAQNIPFMKILGLPKGGQKGVHGPVVCVPSNIRKTTTVLPRSAENDLLLRVKLKRKISYKGYAEYQFVNTKHLEEALLFLKTNNIWYNQLELNDKWLNPIQEVDENDDIMEGCSKQNVESSDVINEQVIEEHEDSFLDDKLRGVQLDTCLQPSDIGQEALDMYFDQVFNISPAEGNNPLSVLKEEGIEAKTFPVHYPSGKNTWNEEREEKLSLMRYFSLRLTSVENRFARDTAYIFFAQYLSELDRVMSNVQISLRKGSAYSANGKQITSQMLCDTDTLNGLFRKDEAIKYLKPVRGTPAFWQATQKDIFAMIRQLGIPTFFCSYSSADFRWAEIIETILKQQGDMRKIEELSWNDKCEILRSNPVTAARMFEHRFHIFLHSFILSESKPIGKVIDYFYRVEFQQRGSPHTHCLFWVEDAPKFDEDSDEDVIEFIDKYITCEIPDEHDDPELYEIVTSVHQHSKNHSKTCRKKGTVCRFNFPRPPSTRTFILRPSNDENDDDNDVQSGDKLAKAKLTELWNYIMENEEQCLTTNDLFQKVGLTQDDFEKYLSLVTKRNTVELKRKPNEIFTNQCNPHLLRAWNANTDIQFVLDAYSCIVYIISYISKAERELGLLLQQTRNEAKEGNLDAQRTMKKIGTAYLHHREISAQEAVFRVIGLRLKECSRKVEFIPVGKNPCRMSIPLKQLQNKQKAKHFKKEILKEDNDSDDDEEMWMSNMVERYKSRPKNEMFNDMCLAQFCSEFNALAESQIPGKINEQTTFYLGKNLGYIRKRTRTLPAVIRYPRFSIESASEEYYQSILQLFLPYQNVDQLKPPKFESYETFYDTGFIKLPKNKTTVSVKSIVDGNQVNYVKNETTLIEAEKQLIEQEPPEDAWGQLCPESEVERRQCIEEGNTVTVLEDEEQKKSIPDLNNPDNAFAETNLLATSFTYNEIVPYMRSLNERQRHIFYKVREWCLRKANGHNPDPFHVFITGGAGTGKSHLIKCMHYEAKRILSPLCENPDNTTVMLTAPTGTAAFNISGMTIHSALGIFKTLSSVHATLGEDKINSLRSKLEDIQILIIDEISMVNKRLLFFVHERLRQIKKVREDCLFGGVSVIAVGDFYQLPPVRTKKSEKLYVNDPSSPLNNLWHDLFSLVELKEVMRQREDGIFAELLNRLRVKQKGENLQTADVNYLMQCVGNGPDNALHIFPTNNECQDYNNEMVMKVCSNPKLVEAQDFDKDQTTGTLKKKKTQFQKADICLPNSILLAEGARVMLIKNEDTSDGLVNGVMGTVMKISDFSTGTLPNMIYVKFDDDKVGKNSKFQKTINRVKCVGIEPSKEDISQSNGVRKQFPLRLAWACTIHKVQGLTVKECVINLNKCFTYGQAYVALSRVTSKSGLHIMDIEESKVMSKIYCDPDIDEGLKAMKPFLSEIQNVISEHDLKIMYHNIEGLCAHKEDLERNPDFQNVDYICLTETWLNKCHSSLKMGNFEIKHLPRSEAFDSSSALYASLKQMNHGGVGVYSRPTSFQEVAISTKNLECILFRITDANILVATVYRTQKYPFCTFMENFKKVIEQLSFLSERTIVMGDFNQDISKGEISLLNYMEQNGYKQHVHEKTTRADTLIDHVYVKGLPAIQVLVIPTYYSFHEAVLIVLDRNSLCN